jgi:hypothetical protein
VEVVSLRDRIVSELTQLDSRKSRTDRHWNRYFLGLALQSLDGFEDDAVRVGTARAFADRFTPCREMFGVARKLDLPLEVDRGRWVLPDGSLL